MKLIEVSHRWSAQKLFINIDALLSHHSLVQDDQINEKNVTGIFMEEFSFNP